MADFVSGFWNGYVMVLVGLSISWQAGSGCYEPVRSAMGRTGGNQSAAARLLGISRAQLIYRLKQLEVGSDT